MKELYPGCHSAVLVCSVLVLRVVFSWRETTEDACAEILNGEHLEDVMINKENEARRSAVLLLYGPQCAGAAEDLWVTLLQAHLPGPRFLAVLRHDHVSAPNNSWFHYSDKYDVAKRLRVAESCCLQVNYVRRGSQELEEALTYPGEDYSHLLTWIWQQSLITVSLHNNLKQDIVLHIEGYLPEGSEETMLVKPDDNITFDSYASNFVTAYTANDEEFLNAFQLKGNANLTVSEQSKYRGKEEVWRIKIHLERMESEESAKLLLCSHHRRHFNILTQPRAVPNFTEDGHLLTKIPEHVHAMLLQIFEQNKKRLTHEYYPNHLTAWNLDEVDIKQVTLSEGKTLYLAEELQPILEAWCKCSLHPTKGEGIVTRIRMYPKGSRVRMHVDEVETGHVIGAILQVTQEPNPNTWPLEIIGYDGIRREILMSPGDMLLFESSRLVHGRPKTLQGEFYVNSFFYFTPREGWDLSPPWRNRGDDSGAWRAEFAEAAGTTPGDVQGQKDGRRSLGHADEL